MAESHPPSPPDPLEDWEGFQAEFQEASDRAVAVLGAALLDAELERLLTWFLVDDEKEVQPLFQALGPFGSFGAKTKIAFTLGLISRDEYDDLSIIRTVRNDFAHGLHGLAFEDRSIKDRCLSLRIPVRTPALLHAAHVAGSPRGLFVWATLMLKNSLDLRMIFAREERRVTPHEVTVREGLTGGGTPVDS